MKFSLSTPKILHLLRCSPCQGHPLLSEMDKLFRSNICLTAIVNLSEMQWTQASPPCRNGGLGVRQASSLALTAFLMSSCSTRSLQDCILMCTAASNNHNFEQYVSLWSSNYGFSVPLDADAHSQCNWDKPNIDAEFANLLSISNTLDRARLLAVSARHSSDWLHAMPISSCGLRLKNEDIRVAVGFRLGTELCKPHHCPYGALVDVTGQHSLSCKLSASKHARPNVINNLIARAITLADIPCVKEPQGLSIEMTESDRME